jgi:hypothetical protein
LIKTVKPSQTPKCDRSEFQDAFLRVGHTRQCVGFTLIHLLVLAAIHPPTTRRQGNATVCGPSFSMTANSSSPVYGAVDIGFQSIQKLSAITQSTL